MMHARRMGVTELYHLIPHGIPFLSPRERKNGEDGSGKMGETPSAVEPRDCRGNWGVGKAIHT